MSTKQQETPATVSTGTRCSESERSFSTAYGALCLLVWLFTCSDGARADIGILPPPLSELRVPRSPALFEGSDPIVIDKEKAILLGKALFWDVAVGSDGVACASCHFHAGADSRTKNQFAPSHAFSPRPDAPNAFDPADPRGPALANYQLRTHDFPLHDPDRPGFDASKATHNVVASSGTFSGTFIRPPTNGSKVDVCTQYGGAQLDQTFHVGTLHTRRVEPRNAPTVINSVLFDRNFWDGRANFYFNGVSSAGPRDEAAHIWVNTASG
ncbi:MAG: hypothetical protein FJ189_13160, partial [Gammaproteobacteria bacterium]|nr:hypothetical protein [Gammaproteobacteria bacterium]